MGERGSATVWLVGLITLITLITLVAGGVTVRGAATIARHRAEAAADLAALAAARRLADGAGEDACGLAAEIARVNGARLAWCRSRGLVVEVGVEVAARFGGLGSFAARARARAGPAVGSGSRSTACWRPLTGYSGRSGVITEGLVKSVARASMTISSQTCPSQYPASRRAPTVRKPAFS